MASRRILLRTHDLKFARAFYEELFECHLRRLSDGRYAFEVGDLEVVLKESRLRAPSEATHVNNYTGITICIDDMEAMKQALDAKHILYSQVKPGKLRVYDPDSNIINVRQWERTPRSQSDRLPAS